MIFLHVHSINTKNACVWNITICIAQHDTIDKTTNERFLRFYKIVSCTYSTGQVNILGKFYKKKYTI